MRRRDSEPDAVSTRTLTAEACASAAMALIQDPASWEGLTTIALLLETVSARGTHNAASLGRELLEIVNSAPLDEAGADRVVQLLTAVDATARAWAAVAHPAPIGAPTLSVVQP